MLTIVLGAPGSGKTAVAGQLRQQRQGIAVIDWDDFMPAVEGLAGRSVQTSPDLWLAYRQLVRSVVTALSNVPVIVLGVCTPDELPDWPAAQWLLLDCDDVERRRRLTARSPDEVEDAIADAREYRRLGLPVVDTTARPLDEIAKELIQALNAV
jgi:broad-specificity NMP kinase